MAHSRFSETYAPTINTTEKPKDPSADLQQLQKNVERNEPSELERKKLEWRENIHFTIDDGPHKNDLIVAREAIISRAHLTFFWLGENFFVESAKQELRKIPAGKTFAEWFAESHPRENLRTWIDQNLDPEKRKIAEEVRMLARNPHNKIAIEYHGVFHPNSQNTEIGETAINSFGEKDGLVRLKSQHHLRLQDSKMITDDLHFFEEIVRTASKDDEYSVSKVRLPGSSKSTALAYLAKLPAKITYVSWDADSNDWRPNKLMTIAKILKVRGNFLAHSRSHFLLNIFKRLDEAVEIQHKIETGTYANFQDHLLQNPQVVESMTKEIEPYNLDKDLCAWFLDLVEKKLGQRSLFEIIDDGSDPGIRNAWRISSSEAAKRLHLGKYSRFENGTIRCEYPKKAEEWYRALEGSEGRRYFTFLFRQSSWFEKISADYFRLKRQGRKTPTPNSHITEVLGQKKYSVVLEEDTSLVKFLLEALSNSENQKHPHLYSLLNSIIPHLNLKINGQQITELSRMIMPAGTKIEWEDFVLLDYLHSEEDGSPWARQTPLSEILLDPDFIPVEVFALNESHPSQKKVEEQPADSYDAPLENRPRENAETLPQSPLLRKYLSEEILAKLGLGYDTMNYQDFLESVFVGLKNHDERLEKYFQACKAIGKSTEERKMATMIRNGEVLTAVICGEIPIENITTEKLYNYLIAYNKYPNQKFKKMEKIGTGVEENSTEIAKKIKNKLKTILSVGEYGILSYSYPLGGHTGIVLRKSEDEFIFYNSGIIENGRYEGVGAENLDEQIGYTIDLL
ncbi:MAG: hypothetical protein V2A63_01410, partial [Patescibacteria group bacterium]